MKKWAIALLPQDNTSSLPGLTVEGEPSGYPMKDDIADYLELYACKYETQ